MAASFARNIVNGGERENMTEETGGYLKPRRNGLSRWLLRRINE
jgi:hypothetical protein